MLSRVHPRLVTFDVTGTLLMTKLVEHYTRIGSRHGIEVSNTRELAQSFKRNFARLANEHPIYGKHTGLGWENWWRQIVYNVFKDQNCQIDDEKLEKVANGLIECYGTSECWHKYPGVVEILECLKQRDVVVGIISNFDERLDSILTSAQIRHYFAFVLTSYGHGFEKPESSIFDEALRLAGQARGHDVRPEEAIHVGDTLDKDYRGAKKARWNALLVNHHREDGDQDDDDDGAVPSAHRFASLEELRKHFETMYSKTSR